MKRSTTMPRLVRNLVIIFSLLTIFSFTACSTSPKFRYKYDSSARAFVKGEGADYPEVSFMVFSDPHTYATELGTEGQAFEDYLARDRKLLKESTEILESATQAMMSEKASFVIAAG